MCWLCAYRTRQFAEEQASFKADDARLGGGDDAKVEGAKKPHAQLKGLKLDDAAGASPVSEQRGTG